LRNIKTTCAKEID